MSGKPNPLIVHAIVLMVVGGALLAFGVIKTVKNVRLSSATRAMHAPSRMKGMAAGATRMPKVNAKNPMGAVRAVGSVGRRAQSTWRMVKRYLSSGWMILCGAGTAAMGFFIFKQKEWSRIVGFAGLGFATLYISAEMGANAAAGMNLAIAIMVALVVSGLCAKFLWDLMTEEFAPA